MKIKLVLIISLLLNGICGVIFLVREKTAMQRTESHGKTTQKTPQNTYRIALFEPAVHPAIEEISQGFRKTMQASNTAQYKFTTYNAQANKTLLRGQAEEIIENNYDLIFTIGAGCTQTIKELTAKKQLSTPVVFCAVDDPVSMHIIDSLQTSRNNLTGVIEQPNIEQQLSLISVLTPYIRRVMLVYDPTHGTGLEKDKQRIEAFFAQKNISLQPIEIYHANEIQQKSSSFMNNTDMVLVLKDNTVVSGIDSLIKLCNQYHVPLYVSDLNSGKKGAALAYGIHEQDSGIESAQKALLILEDKQSPSTIPITPVFKTYIQINAHAMKQQNLSIDHALFFIFASGIVVNDGKQTHA